MVEGVEEPLKISKSLNFHKLRLLLCTYNFVTFNIKVCNQFYHNVNV